MERLQRNTEEHPIIHMHLYCSKENCLENWRITSRMSRWEENQLKDAFPMIEDRGCFFFVALLLDYIYTVGSYFLEITCCRYSCYLRVCVDAASRITQWINELHCNKQKHGSRFAIPWSALSLIHFAYHTISLVLSKSQSIIDIKKKSACFK